MTRILRATATHCAKACLVVLILSITGVTARTYAHAGHDDGPATPTAAAVPAHPTHTATTRDLEIVARHEPLVPGVRAALDVYVNDFASDAPIGGARIAARLASPARGTVWQGAAAPGTAPGAYRASVVVPLAGTYNLIVEISGPRSASVAMSGVIVSVPAAPVTASPRRSSRGWILAVGLALVGGLALGVMMGRRRSRGTPTSPSGRAGLGGRPSAIASAILLLLAGATIRPAPACAHEGHDAGPVSSAGGIQPGVTVWLGKESQFAAGVRTIVTQPDAQPHELALLGRVVPSPRGKADVTAPQSGRLDTGASGFPILGQTVRRGQSLGSILVIDALTIRAPIGGVISEVDVVPGQTVQAGQKLLTIVDASEVWVHADVFPSDAATVTAASRALVSVPGLAGGPVLVGRRVASGLMTGETPGTMELWFAVPNHARLLTLGAIANVAVESAQLQTGIHVPRSALLEQNGQTSVFVHMAPEQFALRAVTVQAGVGDPVLVTSGVTAGERVVVSGAYQLMTGGTPLAPR